MGNYLTYVTLLHKENDKTPEVLVSCIIDLNPITIKRIVKQKDGTTGLVFHDGSVNKLITKFEDFIEFFKSFANINEHFKEEFDSYVNNNWGKV